MRKRLIVGLDQVATVRQAAGALEPDPVAAASLAALGGADGVAVHLREDRRHIQDRDVRLLQQTVHSGFILEMTPSQETLKIALELRPASVVLVQETDVGSARAAGLDVVTQLGVLGEAIRALDDGYVPNAVLIQPDLDQVKAAHRIGAGAIRLHTGRFAEGGPDQASERTRLADAARLASKLGLGVGIGGGLDARSLRGLLDLDGVSEVCVGHAIVARAILVGMERAVREIRDVVD